MQIRYLLALCLLSGVVFADNTQPQSSHASHCVVLPPVPLPTAALDADSEISLEEIRIRSTHSEAQMGQKAKFSGNVTVSQGSRFVAAQEAIIDQKKQHLDAKGNLIFQDTSFTVTAESLSAKILDNNATLLGAQYWLHGQQVHGDAEQLDITHKNDLLLTNTNFTTCPPDQVSWLLEAEKIKIDSEEEWGEIWNANLRIADIPVLYIPYLTVPITDKRKSGLLFPQFSSSTTNGVEFALPYYWDIAPEYDATFTPHYMSSRGLFLKTEFRYLAGEAQQGRFNLEFLGDDDKLVNSPNRYLYHWEHKGAIDEHWRLQADITEVSDDNFFNDLDSEISRSTDNQLSRHAEVSYFEHNWNVGIRVQDIDVLGAEADPYQVMPQFDFNYSANDIWQNIDFSLNTEITNFTHTDNQLANATRLHMEPTLTLPIYQPAGSLTAEVKLLQTNYWQSNLVDGSNLEDSVSRTIPQVRVHSQVNFERPTELFKQQFRQTLEPQLQYLYTGHEKQSGIGLYDTAQLQNDYLGLFRDRRFSGLDRIANANQITYGLTTRLFDQKNNEEFKFSVGQIIYFDNNRVQLDEDIDAGKPSSSVMAAELDMRLYQDWFLSGSLQYDTKQSDNQKTEISLDFRPEANKLLQLSYRYVPDLLNTNNNNTVNIAQSGVRAAWPITDNIYFVGNWYYDLNEHRSVENYTGFQYESCCWAARISYHHRIKTNYNDFNDPSVETRELFESGIFLNFVIKGLGGAGPLGVEDMLNDGLFNYRKPLYLRN